MKIFRVTPNGGGKECFYLVRNKALCRHKKIKLGLQINYCQLFKRGKAEIQFLLKYLATVNNVFVRLILLYDLDSNLRIH